MEADYPKISYVMEKEGLNKICKWAKDAKPEDNPHTKEKRYFLI
jgi:hypothetical protein